MRNNRLLEKVALITGAGRGIGSAITKKFSQEGAKVIINYNQSKKEATNLEKDIQKKGGEVISLKADVSNIEEVTFMIKNIINRFSRIDILVNNAGILFPATFNQTTESIWDKTMDINIKGAFLCCKEVAPIMLKQEKGKIINISSICGLAERSAL